MKKNRKLDYVAIGMIFTLIFAVVTPASAATTEMVKQITASFTSNGNRIIVYVNGTKIKSKDSSGNEVYPFTTEGTTYLPVRAIAGALGKTVTWDGATASIIITDNANFTIPKDDTIAESVSTQDTVKQLTACFTSDGNPISIYINGTKITAKDGNGNEVSPFIVDGTTYLPVRAVAEALGKDVAWDEDTASVKLNDAKVEPLVTPAPTPVPTPTTTVKPDNTVTVPSEIKSRNSETAKLTTIKNEKGEYHDKIEYTFTLDKDAVGEWKNVGWYEHLRQFDPAKPSTKNQWFTSMSIYEDGSLTRHLTQGADPTKKDDGGYHWTNGYFVDILSKSSIDAVPAYMVTTINGKKYMFVEWKSMDYVKKGIISYYIFEKISDMPAPKSAE